jgi:thioredoxin 1
MRCFRFLFLAALCAIPVLAQSSFTGTTQWQAALAAGNASSLKALYSVSPPARFMAKGKPSDDISPETDFWTKQLTSGVSGVKVNTVAEQDQNGLHIVSLQVVMTADTADGPKPRWVTEEQAWQLQGDQWRIVMATHSDVLKMRQPTKLNPNLYPKDADAKTEINEALAKSAKQHKHVILVFGGNWCYDCHVLDNAFHQPELEPLVDKNFEVVHVDIGDDDKNPKNADLITKYKIPLERGVPALAVLDSDGKLLYSQQNGEFEAARSMDPNDIVAFLNKWKP